MDNKPYIYIVTIGEYTSTVHDTNGTLYAVGSDLHECFTRFVSQIRCPSKGQHPFIWSRWPKEHTYQLKSIMLLERNKLQDELTILNGWLKATQ